MFFENDGHFGRHLGLLKRLHGDFRGLFVCYSIHIPGPILNKSACYENDHLLANVLAYSKGCNRIFSVSPL